MPPEAQRLENRTVDAKTIWLELADIHDSKRRKAVPLKGEVPLSALKRCANATSLKGLNAWPKWRA